MAESAEIPVICIDGPGGSGKGTIAAKVASELGFHLLDSGALYRLTGLSAENHNVPLDNEEEVAILAQHLDVRFVPGETELTILLEGQNVTNTIRTEEVGNLASTVARLPKVRQSLLARQHSFAESPGLVADGRDMGTVVFPSSPLKIYLTASVEARAERRYKQLKEKGFDASLPALREDIRSRDDQDMNREVAPLKSAEDAVIIDSTDLSIDQVFQQVLELVQQRLS